MSTLDVFLNCLPSYLLRQCLSLGMEHQLGWSPSLRPTCDPWRPRCWHYRHTATPSLFLWVWELNSSPQVCLKHFAAWAISLALTSLLTPYLTPVSLSLWLLLLQRDEIISYTSQVINLTNKNGRNHPASVCSWQAAYILSHHTGLQKWVPWGWCN